VQAITSETAGQYSVCWSEDCDYATEFRVATPHGQWDSCDYHVDELIADLPAEWIEGWKRREAPPPMESDDIPF
jgi:hypothetical protein